MNVINDTSLVLMMLLSGTRLVKNAFVPSLLPIIVEQWYVLVL